MKTNKKQSLIEQTAHKLNADERLDYILLTETIAGMADGFKGHYRGAESGGEKSARLATIHSNVSSIMDKVLKTPVHELELPTKDHSGLDHLLFNCGRSLKRAYLTAPDEASKKQSYLTTVTAIKESQKEVFGKLEAESDPQCPPDFCATEQGACIPCIGNQN